MTLMGVTLVATLCHRWTCDCYRRCPLTIRCQTNFRENGAPWPLRSCAGAEEGQEQQEQSLYPNGDHRMDQNFQRRKRENGVNWMEIHALQGTIEEEVESTEKLAVAQEAHQ